MLTEEKFQQFCRAISEFGPDHALVLQDGRMLARHDWVPEVRQNQYSITKSITGTAIGFALDEGLLHLEDPVIRLLPDCLPPVVSPHLEHLTLYHLLTMTLGQKAPWLMGEQREFMKEKDYARFALSRPFEEEPGTCFLYSNVGPYLAGLMLERRSGQSLAEYLMPRLFDPLGITNVSWEQGPQGYNVGGWGLMLTTEDLLKTGVFLLQKGQWEGRQLLSRDWVEHATTVQIPMHSSSNPEMAGYGYQIWVDSREKAFSLRGACGQVCTVFPELGAVVAYTAGTNGPEREAIENLIWNTLVPGMKSPGYSAEGRAAWEREQQRMAGFRIPVPAGKPSWEAACREASGKRYLLGDNRLNWNAITFRFAEQAGQRDTFTLESREGTFTAEIGFGEWVDGATCVKTEDTDTDVSLLFEKVSAAGAWQEDGRYLLQLCFRETSYINTMKISFAGNGMAAEHTRNCSFMESTNAVLTGAALEAGQYALYENGARKQESGYR